MTIAEWHELNVHNACSHLGHCDKTKIYTAINTDFLASLADDSWEMHFVFGGVKRQNNRLGLLQLSQTDETSQGFISTLKIVIIYGGVYDKRGWSGNQRPSSGVAS